MRKSLQQLTNSIRPRFNFVDEAYIDDVIAVELMGMALHLMDMKLAVQDAWILFTNFHEPIVPPTTRKDILMRIRLLLQDYHYEKRWSLACVRYGQVDPKYKVIESIENEHVTFITAALYNDRIEEYKKILHTPLTRVQANIQFLPENEFHYIRQVNDVPQVFSGMFSNTLRTEPTLLERYRKKRPIDLLSIETLHEVAKKFDERLNKGTDEWRTRLAPLSLERLYKSEGTHHIIGGLGAGKTTYRELMTYAAVKQQGARVLIVENKVTDVFELASLYKKLGLKVAVLTSVHRQRENFNKVMYQKELHTAEDVEEELAYTYLTGTCLLRTLAGDALDTDAARRYLPCTQLRKKGSETNYMCPLIDYCGIYEAHNELKEADVWITTEAALLTMTLPPMIDPYRRTIYEAAYDLVDLIFIDEADAVRRRFEEHFIDEVTLFSLGEMNAIEKLNAENIQLFRKNPRRSVDEIHRWRNNSLLLQNNIEQLYELLNDNDDLRRLMSRNPVYLDRLLYRLLEKIDDHPLIKKELRAYKANVEDRDTELYTLARLTNRQEKVTEATRWLNSQAVYFSSPKQKNEWIDELLLFLYLANIQYALNYIHIHRYVAQQYNLQIDELLVDDRLQKFQPFIRDSMTGLKQGFRFDYNNGIEQIKWIVYRGIGADLFYKWQDLFEAIDETKGPEVVYLSGTSYIKGSPHYHLETPVHLSLTTARRQPTIEQFIFPLYDEEEMLYVSGQSPIERENVLRKMVYQLTDSIIEELKVWESRGEQRRVLLIVNSYRDVEIVHEALKENDVLQDRYAVLSRDPHSTEKGDLYRSELLTLHERDVSLVAAPLHAINRGYNILQKHSTKSLFGSVFFLTRPYPTPKDLHYFVAYLHGMYPTYIQSLEKEGLSKVKALRKLRQKSNHLFRSMYQDKGTWVSLDEKEKQILSMYVFVPMWQLIGRLLRGGTDARVFYCDAKLFTDHHAQPTMIDCWKSLLLTDIDGPMEDLYGPFIESLKQLKVGV